MLQIKGKKKLSPKFFFFFQLKNGREKKNIIYSLQKNTTHDP